MVSFHLTGTGTCTWIQTKLLKQNQAKQNEWAASPSPLGKQFIEITLVQGHVLRQKCLEVEDVLAPHGNPVLVEGRRLDNLVLERVVQIPHELQSEGLNDDFGGDAVDEELVHVQFLPGREEVLRTLVARNVGGQLLDVHLPVRLQDGSICLEAATVRVALYLKI